MVIIKSVIDKSGNVGQVKVLKGLPEGSTAQVVRTVCEWKFEPATRGGKPIAVTFNFSREFSLLERK